MYADCLPLAGHTDRHARRWQHAQQAEVAGPVGGGGRPNRPPCRGHRSTRPPPPHPHRPPQPPSPHPHSTCSPSVPAKRHAGAGTSAQHSGPPAREVLVFGRSARFSAPASVRSTFSVSCCPASRHRHAVGGAARCLRPLAARRPQQGAVGKAPACGQPSAWPCAWQEGKGMQL